MIDFIPLEYYSDIFQIVMGVCVLFLLVHTYIYGLEEERNLRIMHRLALFMFVFTVVYMGLRPISGRYFGDMIVYSRRFNQYAFGEPWRTNKDVLFQFYIWVMAQLTSVTFFFLTCAFLYVYPLYVACRRIFKAYWSFGFIILLVSMSFWAYGTNGIRNGIASSVFILGLSYYYQPRKMWAWFILSVFIHKSMMLPAAAAVIPYFIRDPRIYFYGWLAAIPMSVLFGGAWEALFSALGFDDRVSYLTDDTYADQFSSTGFRWDFLLYSASAVFVGWYFIFKKGLKDLFFQHMVGIYLISNAFWILVIRASFSNRFAYLSWFMMGLVICYPVLKKYYYNDQYKLMGQVLILYFIFTLAINVFL